MFALSPGSAEPSDSFIAIPIKNFISFFSPALYLEDKQSDLADEVENANWESHANNRLSTALVALDERSQDIIKTRWLAEDKSTLQDLANKYQISAERVRQLEKNALNKLKNTMVL